MTKYKVNKQLESFKNDLIVFVDTRERKCSHILSFFDKNNIKYSIQKLDTGDYSFKYLDYDYSNIFSIDRKQNIDELVGNLSEKRFLNELNRALNFNKFLFVVENGCLSDLYAGNYRSKINNKSVVAMIETWKVRGIDFEFISGVSFGKVLTTKIYYYVRNQLLKGSI
jgi:ERCC4-type nuclease